VTDDDGPHLIGGGASTRAVSELENAIGISLPPTVKSLLTTYGALSVYDDFLSGIIDDEPLSTESGCLYGDTLTLRDGGATVEVNRMTNAPRYLLIV